MGGRLRPGAVADLASESLAGFVGVRSRCIESVVEKLRSHLTGWKEHFWPAETPGTFDAPSTSGFAVACDWSSSNSGNVAPRLSASSGLGASPRWWPPGPVLTSRAGG
jgi:hypothetical protein